MRLCNQSWMYSPSTWKHSREFYVLDFSGVSHSIPLYPTIPTTIDSSRYWSRAVLLSNQSSARPVTTV